jgi:aspartate/glutamate racemase
MLGVIRGESQRGCLEAGDALIALLLEPSELSVPAFDTTRSHAWAAVNAAVAG